MEYNVIIEGKRELSPIREIVILSVSGMECPEFADDCGGSNWLFPCTGAFLRVRYKAQKDEHGKYKDELIRHSRWYLWCSWLMSCQNYRFHSFELMVIGLKLTTTTKKNWTTITIFGSNLAIILYYLLIIMEYSMIYRKGLPTTSEKPF